MKTYYNITITTEKKNVKTSGLNPVSHGTTGSLHGSLGCQVLATLSGPLGVAEPWAVRSLGRGLKGFRKMILVDVMVHRFHLWRNCK